MTGKEIQAAKDLLHMRYYGDNARTPDNLIRPRLKEDEVFEEELSCREMINSILIYNGSCSKESYSYHRYLLPYTRKENYHKGLISVKRLQELIKEQQDSFSRATVGFAGYDSEGVSYNYCKWEDD